MIDEVTTLFHC